MNPNTTKEILDQWQKVQADRKRCRYLLDNTGPGESPYSQAEKEAWDIREHCLARTLLAAMPELSQLLDAGQIPAIQATKCAGCGERKNTPLRRDDMGGYVCLTCVDKRLNELNKVIAWIASQENLFFAEASQAEEIVAKCREVL